MARDVAGQRSAAMDVPEHHPVRLHPEPVDDPRQGGDARASHLRAERSLGERRDAPAERAPGAARHRGGAQQFGHLSVSPSSGRGSHRVSSASRRVPTGRLVVGRRRPVARQAAEQPAGDTVRRLGQQVTVEVVPVRGPDPIAEPDAGIADAHARGAQPRRQAGERGRRVEGDRGVEAERPVARPHPRAHEPGVVVARDDEDLGLAPEPRAERAQHRLGDVHRLARAPLQQLDDVAEQHQALDAVQRGEQRLERLGAAQDVAPETGAEVQVGDDEGRHGRADGGIPADL